MASVSFEQIRRGVSFVAILMIAACATAQNGETEGGTTSSTGAGGGDAGAMHVDVACSLGMPCKPGETCLNGVCAAGCNTDADCDKGQYCALSNGQVCLDATLPACPATSCAATQVCVDGICGTVPTGMSCGPSPFDPEGDGCPKDQLCLKNVVVDGMLKPDPVCYALPPCPESGVCSPGGAGALCNTGFLKEKNKVCIPGACEDATNCPASWQCVQLGGMTGYGACTDGSTGTPCGKTADCKSGLQCHTPIANQPGTCM